MRIIEYSDHIVIESDDGKHELRDNWSHEQLQHVDGDGMPLAIARPIDGIGNPFDSPRRY